MRNFFEEEERQLPPESLALWIRLKVRWMKMTCALDGKKGFYLDADTPIAATEIARDFEFPAEKVTSLVQPMLALGMIQRTANGFISKRIRSECQRSNKNRDKTIAQHARRRRGTGPDPVGSGTVATNPLGQIQTQQDAPHEKQQTPPDPMGRTYRTSDPVGPDSNPRRRLQTTRHSDGNPMGPRNSSVCVDSYSSEEKNKSTHTHRGGAGGATHGVELAAVELTRIFYAIFNPTPLHHDRAVSPKDIEAAEHVLRADGERAELVVKSLAQIIAKKWPDCGYFSGAVKSHWMPQARQMAAHQSCREQQHQADQTQRQEAARAAADYDAKRQQLEQIWRSMSPVDQAAMEGKVRTEFAHHTPEKVHQLCLELLSDCSGKGAT